MPFVLNNVYFFDIPQVVWNLEKSNYFVSGQKMKYRLHGMKDISLGVKCPAVSRVFAKIRQLAPKTHFIKKRSVSQWERRMSFSSKNDPFTIYFDDEALVGIFVLIAQEIN
jgi:hypothetical protein